MCSSSTGALEGHSTHLHVGRTDLHPLLDPPVGGLQMAYSFEHIPVLRDEVVSLFASVPPGAGRRRDDRRRRPRRGLAGGVPRPAHCRARPRSGRSARRPAGGCPPSGTASRSLPLRSPRWSRFSPRPGFGPLAGVLLDLGVSSPQLDWSERGFLVPRGRTARHADGPDHRPHRRRPRQHPAGGGPGGAVPRERRGPPVRAHRPAVVKARPLTSTRQLAEVVASAVPAPARRKGHPARRVFQALRIQVNDELGQLEAVLPAALSHLEVGGVCAVISYHSGEDRLTKRVFADAATRRVCLPSRPALRLRCRGAPSACLPRRAQGIGGGGRRQSPLRERPPAAIVRTEPEPDARRRSLLMAPPPAATATATRRHAAVRLPAPHPAARAWRRSSFDPARPAPGRPDPQPARHSRGPHRCWSGQAADHRVRFHGGGRACWPSSWGRPSWPTAR